MCFMLYAGTSKPIPRKEWDNDAPELSVETLGEREAPIAAHFSKPEVQYIGSTSGCGCDFPHGAWFDDNDPEQEASERKNRESLVNLLRATREQTIELYGVWDGDFEISPAVREEIALAALLDPAFRLEEQRFYIVHLE